MTKETSTRVVLSKLHGNGGSLVLRTYDPFLNTIELFISNGERFTVPLGDRELYDTILERAAILLREGQQVNQIEIRWNYQRKALLNGTETRNSSTAGRCVFSGERTLLNYTLEENSEREQPQIAETTYMFNRAAQWCLEGGKAARLRKSPPNSFVEGLERLLEGGLFPSYVEIGLFAPLVNPISHLERDGMFFLGCYGHEGKEKEDKTGGKHYTEGGIIFNHCTARVVERE